VILLTVGAAFSFASAHGQQIAWSQFIWTAWENAAVAKRGPDVSEGLLLYFHGFDPSGADGERIEEIFIQMARLARWDILRINRVPFVDEASQDEELLRYVDQQVVKARNEGYRRIIAAGSSRGGWLALSAASLDGVDGAIGLAPGTDDFTPELLEWQRAELARRLGRARAKRIAVAFFEGDELENTKEPRALAVRPALASTFAAFMIIDRPAGLLGHAAPVSGRFIRRYRDCLLDLMRAIDPRPGETECSQTEGYAVGSDIGFRDFAQLTSSPGNPFSPYLARWQGRRRGGRLCHHAARQAVRRPCHLPLRPIAFALHQDRALGSRYSFPTRRWCSCP